MTLQSLKLVSESICLLVVAGCAVYVAYLAAGAANDMHNTQVAAQTSVASVTETMEYINRPCASLDAKGHLLKDGTLCQLNNAIHDVRKIATASGKQVQQTSEVITAMSRNLDAAGDSVSKVATATAETAQQATATLKTTETTVASLQAPISRISPLLDAYTETGQSANQAVRDFDALLKSPDALGAIHHINGTLDNVQGITGDIRIETSKMVAPKTRAQKIFGWLPTSLKLGAVGACLATGTPCP